MPDLLVRDLDPKVIERLKAQAKRHRRSLQGEARSVLTAGARLTMEEARAEMARVRQQLAGRRFSDSAELIREDRGR